MKFKTLLLTILVIFSVTLLFPQNIGINETGATPNNSAILDVESDNKGVLIPRMNNAQMNAISSPSEGLLIFNTKTKCFHYFDGTAWDAMCGINNGGGSGGSGGSGGLGCGYAIGDNFNGWGTVVAIDAAYGTCGLLIMNNADESSFSETWGAANNLCNNSNAGSQNDWRLASIAELELIHTNGITFGGSTPYWSSTPAGGSDYFDRRMDNTAGPTSTALSGYLRRVRCFREH
ncbi:MAG: DUF1566 domain-containing protein [Crocinitomicaceae bacterium]|nr:DUF1566 domain-containing protein [Crocinitomicaceae bacterium]